MRRPEGVFATFWRPKNFLDANLSVVGKIESIRVDPPPRLKKLSVSGRARGGCESGAGSGKSDPQKSRKSPKCAGPRRREKCIQNHGCSGPGRARRPESSFSTFGRPIIFNFICFCMYTKTFVHKGNQVGVRLVGRILSFICVFD